MIVVGVAAMLAAVFRLPATLSTRHLGYDDGVYGASVQLMDAGYAPFRDFFSSQGPVYLPLLRLADLLPGPTTVGVRVAMMLTGAFLAIGTFLVARHYAGRLVAAGVAFLVATSGTLMAAAAPLQSDGVALAFGTMGLAILLGSPQPGSSQLGSPQLGSPPARVWRPVAVGALVGLALMTKSLHLVPVAIVVAAVYSTRRQWRELATAVATATLVGLAVTLPWGVSNVWDQYVAFHLSRPDQTSWTSNVTEAVHYLVRFEQPLLALAVVTVLAIGARWPRSGPPATSGSETRAPWWLPAVWLVTTLAVLIPFSTIDGGFVRFLGFVVVPLVVVVAQLRPPVAAVLVVAVIAGPYQWQTAPFLEVRHPDGLESTVITRLEALPPGASMVSDEPGLGWIAGVVSHPATVDVSFGRIFAADIGRTEVLAAIDDPATCAVMSWSTRFASLGIEPPTSGYEPAESFGEHRWLAVRSSCIAGGQ